VNGEEVMVITGPNLQTSSLITLGVVIAAIIIALIFAWIFSNTQKTSYPKYVRRRKGRSAAASEAEDMLS